MSVARGRNRRFPTSTLNRFEEFPLEIQLDIWKYASFLPRAVAIDVKKLGGGYEPENLKWFRWTSTTPVPALFSVCRISRLEAMKYYKRCFVAKQHSDFGFEISLVPRFYINPESDIICPVYRSDMINNLPSFTPNQCCSFQKNIRNLGIKHVGINDAALDVYHISPLSAEPFDHRYCCNHNSNDRYLRSLCGYWNHLVQLIEEVSFQLESITVYTRHRGYDDTKPLSFIPFNEDFLKPYERVRADIIDYDIYRVLIHNMRGWVERQVRSDLEMEAGGFNYEPVSWTLKPGTHRFGSTEWVPYEIYDQPPLSLRTWVPPRVERMMTEDMQVKRLRGSKKPSSKKK
ncbi:hypothetical protein NHQ30_007600 [Ciborinia camelliae]|nr:hypothetical protein NHQ30_007600 [Ciborinia camelliae]